MLNKKSDHCVVVCLFVLLHVSDLTIYYTPYYRYVKSYRVLLGFLFSPFVLSLKLKAVALGQGYM